MSDVFSDVLGVVRGAQGAVVLETYPVGELAYAPASLLTDNRTASLVRILTEKIADTPDDNLLLSQLQTARMKPLTNWRADFPLLETAVLELHTRLTARMQTQREDLLSRLNAVIRIDYKPLLKDLDRQRPVAEVIIEHLQLHHGSMDQILQAAFSDNETVIAKLGQFYFKNNDQAMTAMGKGYNYFNKKQWTQVARIIVTEDVSSAWDLSKPVKAYMATQMGAYVAD
jgi:hypothetical protein